MRYIKCIVICLLIVNSWAILTQVADLQTYHIDEHWHVTSAINFLLHGNYRPGVLAGDMVSKPLITSVGLSVVWPAGVVGLLGGSLLSVRLAVSLQVWLFSLLVGLFFFQHQGFRKKDALLLVCLVWAVHMTTPFAIPYWFGFVMSLGEAMGALYVALGMLVFKRYPKMSALLLGMAVWQCKFIYLAPAVGFLGVQWCFIVTEGGRSLKKILPQGLFFMLPAFIWCGIFLVLKGPDFVMLLLGQYLDHVQWFGGKTFGVGRAAVEVHSLRERLVAPELEWTSILTFGTKLKVLALSVGAMVVSLVLSVAFWKRFKLVTHATVFAMVGVIGAYTYWWFCLHPHMWVRHFQPAMYVGLGLYLYWASWFYKECLRQMDFVKKGAWGLLIVFICWQTYMVYRAPLLSQDSGAKRYITDLFQYGG